MTALAAAKYPKPPMEGEPPDMVGDNPAAAYAPLADKAVVAWNAPGALEGETEFGPGIMPAEFAASVTLFELVVHGWDLATATGQQLHVDPDIAEATYQISQQLASDDSRKGGYFGTEVSVSADSPVMDRMLGLIGRNPA